MTGSGKTTFAIRYLLNVPAACRFVFDDMGQVAARLKRPQAGTAAELESALGSKWVIFNPHRMFPGDVTAAFAFFCQWAFDASRRGPGKKVFVADEVWRFCSPQAIPRELAVIAQMGRAENLELVTATQLPHKVNASITGQSGGGAGGQSRSNPHPSSGQFPRPEPAFPRHARGSALVKRSKPDVLA
jgi:hypothetical protein